VSVLPGQQATYQCRTHKECTALLHRLSHSHAWQRALEVVGVFRQNVLEPNIINRNALLSSLQRGRQWARVCSLLFARSRTDVWSFSTAAGAFDSWRSPLWLLERIGHARHAPNVVLAGAILSSCEVPGAWSMALALFGQMSTAMGISPNTVALASAQTACEKSSQWAEAVHFLIQAQLGALLPNVVAGNVAVSACARISAWERALVLASAADHADLVTFNSAVDACHKAQRWEWALELVRTLVARRLTPDVALISEVRFRRPVYHCGRGVRQLIE
ncbi:unnamed protein product, partial [Effrenium voratum]